MAILDDCEDFLGPIHVDGYGFSQAFYHGEKGREGGRREKRMGRPAVANSLGTSENFSVSKESSWPSDLSRGAVCWDLGL